MFALEEDWRRRRRRKKPSDGSDASQSSGGKLGSAATECSRSYPPAATSLDGLAATGFSRGPEVKTMAWPAAVTCKVNANGRQGLIIMTWPVLKYWELVISDLLLIDIFLEEFFFERAPNT